MTRGIEKEMYDRLLALQEKTVVALEKGHAEVSRLGDLIEKMEQTVSDKCRTDERMGLWMKVLTSMVALAGAALVLVQALS